MKKRDNAFAEYQKNTIEYYRQSAFLHRSSPAFAVVYYSTTPRDPYTPSPIVNFFAVLTIAVILVTWFILIRKTQSRTATGPQSLSVNDAEQQMPESEMSKKYKMDIALIIIFVILLVVFRALKVGDYFSPWTLTIGYGSPFSSCSSLSQAFYTP